jgi:DDE family transposase
MTFVTGARGVFWGVRETRNEYADVNLLGAARSAEVAGNSAEAKQFYTKLRQIARCGPCLQRPQCTSAAFRSLIIHQHEPARQRARELVNTPEFAHAQRQRKKVEALFAELKNLIGLRRLRLRRLKFVREQFFLAAAAQNIKRLVRFLSQPTRPVLPATT